MAAADRVRAQAAVVGFFAGSVDATRIVAVDRTTAAVALPGLDALVERAEAVRGEIIALRKDAESAHFAARAADRRWIPEPEIIAGTKSSTVGGGDIGSVVTVQASVPVFDRGRPERALAVARAAQADARIDAFRQTVRAEIAAWRAAVLERRDAANRYRSAAVQSAGQIERIAQVSYDAGERGILELLDSLRVNRVATLRLLDLQAGVKEAFIELERALGEEVRP